MPEGGGEAPLEGAGRGRQVLPLAATQSLGAAAAGGAGRAAVLAAHPEGPAGVSVLCAPCRWEAPMGALGTAPVGGMVADGFQVRKGRGYAVCCGLREKTEW